MSKLNHDILYEIFQDLFYLISTNSNNEERYKKSLHSCLLVNKLWCEVMIPILWSYPCKYVFKKKSFLNIIISHLSDNLIKLLKDKNNIETNFKKQKLSFNYVRFCRYLEKIDFIIPVHSILLREEIYKLFISECSSIKSLHSDMVHYSILKYPGANISLSNLYELYCITNDQDFYHGLAQICMSIEKIYVKIYSEESSGIAELIEMQKQIKYIFIKGFFESKKITQALEKHVNSIIHLETVTCTSYLYFLIPKLNNLEYLRIHDSSYKLKNYVTHLNYYKLQTLNFDGISSLDMAINIIKNTNGNLQKIRIECIQFYDKAKEYNQTIHKYCPNIKYVTVFLNRNGTLEELENIFIKCQHLEAIDIEDNIECKYIDKFLDLLAELAPPTLCKIYIYYIPQSIRLFLFNQVPCKSKKTLQYYYQIIDCPIDSNITHNEHKYDINDFWNYYITWLYE